MDYHDTDQLLKLAYKYFVKTASVTFVSDADSPDVPVREPCLCTQMDERFSDWVQHGAGPDEDMRAAASPECWTCHGSGVEAGYRSTGPELNLANVNAAALLGTLGLPPGELWGAMSVHEAKRALMRARNRSSLEQFTVEPIENVPGRMRIHDPGVTEEGIRERLDRFEKFLDNAIAQGATTISWG